jgi:hypothetical protein
VAKEKKTQMKIEMSKVAEVVEEVVEEEANKLEIESR